MHSFASAGDAADARSPVIDVKGMLYGTTYSGGDQGFGALYSLDPQTGQENLLFSFSDRAQGALIRMQGTLYSTTSGFDDYGTVFSFNLKTNSERYVYLFCQLAECADGAAPRAGLVELNGKLYGTTAAGGIGGACNQAFGCGALFSIDPVTGSEEVIYSFCNLQTCADGSNPVADLVAVDGMLYGTTYSGGTTGCPGGLGCGTVFSVNPMTGAEKVLHIFCVNGRCADGALPAAGMIALNGILYGTTAAGGKEFGTLFSINPSTGAEKVLHNFRGGKDGSSPLARLVAVKGRIFGTTSEGGGTGCGGTGCGTVFSLDPSSGVEKVVYSFQGGSDGASPLAGLIDVKGALFGTTSAGGGTGCGGIGCGTVFSLVKVP